MHTEDFLLSVGSIYQKVEDRNLSVGHTSADVILSQSEAAVRDFICTDLLSSVQPAHGKLPDVSHSHSNDLNSCRTWTGLEHLLFFFFFRTVTSTIEAGSHFSRERLASISATHSSVP